MTITLANTSTTPVALHLASGVAIVGAQDHIECSEEDLAVGQVSALVRRGILTAHRTDDPAPARKASDRPRKRSSGRRRTE
jgi:hypothetical protein